MTCKIITMKLTQQHTQERYMTNKLLIGWKEWCALKGLGIKSLKAKIDTGARTSSLHAENITPFLQDGESYVSFQVFPFQNNTIRVVNCQAKVIDERMIMSSNGQKELRYIIKTPITLGPKTWDIELSLSNRDPLKFRMLLGREALQGLVIIDPEITFFQGRVTKKSYGF